MFGKKKKEEEGKIIEKSSLPVYRTDEYRLTFEVKRYKNVDHFKKRGELTAKSEVEVTKGSYDDYSGSGHTCFNANIRWYRHTLNGAEWIDLGLIDLSESFLTFLDKFFVEGNEIYFQTSKQKRPGKWFLDFGTLSLACELCERDPDGFEKIVIRAKNKEDLLIQLGVS